MATFTDEQFKTLCSKLDTITRLLSGRQNSSQVDDLNTVLKTAGMDELKRYVRTMPKRGKA